MPDSAILGFGHDTDVAGLLENLSQTITHNRVIISNHYCDHSLPPLPLEYRQ